MISQAYKIKVNTFLFVIAVESGFSFCSATWISVSTNSTTKRSFARIWKFIDKITFFSEIETKWNIILRIARVSLPLKHRENIQWIFQLVKDKTSSNKNIHFTKFLTCLCSSCITVSCSKAGGGSSSSSFSNRSEKSAGARDGRELPVG